MSFFLALLMSLVLSSAATHAAPTESCAFNTDFCGADATGGVGDASIVGTPTPPEGAGWYRAELDAADPFTSGGQSRIEKIWNNECQKTIDTGAGDAECWQGVTLVIPVDSGADKWVDTTTQCQFQSKVVLQMQNGNDDACDNLSDPPTISIEVKNPEEEWEILTTTWNDECVTSTSQQDINVYTIGDVVRGQEEDFVIHADFSSRNGTHGSGTSTLNADGNLKVWRNGTLVLNQQNIKLGKNNANSGMQIRQGVYTSCWGNNGANAGDRLVNFRDSWASCDKSQNSLCGFSDVDPAGGSEPPTIAPTFASCSIGNADPQCISVVHNDDSLNLLPATNCTGYVPGVNGDRTLSSCNRTASFTNEVCFSGDPANIADTVTVRYSPGNVTDDDTNAMQAFSDQTCSNTIGPALLASATLVADSGNFNPDRGCDKLIDGDTTTESGSSWAQQQTSFFCTWQLDQQREIQNTRWFGDLDGSSQCVTLAVAHSTNGVDFTTDFSGQNCNVNQWFSNSTIFTASYVRVTVTGTTDDGGSFWGSQLREFQVFGDPAIAETFRTVYQGGTYKGVKLQ